MSGVRAFRNNNPGNINAGAKWQGLCPRAKMTPEQAAETRFCVFSYPVWGFRALGIILHQYQQAHKLNTIRQIVNRWAPPGENDTGAYVHAVAVQMGIDPDAPLDLSNESELASLAKSISVHECGGWLFTDQDLNQGISMSLGEAPLAA